MDRKNFERHEDIQKISLKLKKFLCFKELEFSMPVDSSNIYCFVGRNGSGKSLFLSVLGTLVRLGLLKYYPLSESLSVEAELEFCFHLQNGKKLSYMQRGKEIGNWTRSHEKYNFIKFHGFYEPSVDFIGKGGYRKHKKTVRLRKRNELRDAPQVLKDWINYILYGRFDGKFSFLKRVDDKNAIDKTDFYLDLPSGDIIPQHFFSTGEYFLIKTLAHFVRTVNATKSAPRFFIIDEIETALHPLAQLRLIEYFVERIKELNKKDIDGVRPKLLLLFSTHSYHVLHRLVNLNMEGSIYIVETHASYNFNSRGKTSLYPMSFSKSDKKRGQKINSILYLLERLMSCFDNTRQNILICEDEDVAILLQYLKDKGILKLPENSLEILGGSATEAVKSGVELTSISDVIGCNKVLIVLDGDVENEFNLEKVKLPIVYLPIPSVSKYLLSLVREEKEDFIYKVFREDELSLRKLVERLPNSKWQELIEDLVKLESLNHDTSRKYWRKLLEALSFWLERISAKYNKEKIKKDLLDYLIKQEETKFYEFSEKISEFFEGN